MIDFIQQNNFTYRYLRHRKGKLRLTRCFTFHDLLHLLDMAGLGATGSSFSIQTQWVSPNPDVRKFIEEQTQGKDSLLNQQLKSKDPEKTGCFSSGDLYLILKDMYLDEKEVVLMLGSSNSSLFTEDNSYLELLSKLNWLYFHVVHLDKNLYKRPKNVLINKDIFFDIIYGLTCCGVLKLMPVKKKGKNANPEDSQDHHDSAIHGTSESSLGGIVANALGGNAARNRMRDSDSSEPSHSNSKKESKGNSSLVKQSMKSKDPSIFQGPPQHQAESKHTLQTAPKQPSEKVELHSRQQSLGLKQPSLAGHNQNQSPNPMFERQHSTPKNLQKSNSFAQEVASSPQQKQLHKLLVGRQQSPRPQFVDVDVHAPMFLKKYEPIWKKSLSEIFHFYQRLQKQTKPLERSFDNAKEKWNSMSSGEWLKFCNDFDLKFNPKPISKSRANSPSYEMVHDSNRQLLSSLFNKESKGSLGINYSGFEVAQLLISENTHSTLSHDRSHQRRT